MATNNIGNEISVETSDRICSHMNEDHAATVYAMAISTLPMMQQSNFSVSDARLCSISLTGVTLKFVTCSGDLCAQKKETIPFNPPLSSARDARPRLIAIHHQVLFPRLHWFFSDTFCTLTSVLTLALIAGPIMMWNATIMIEGSLASVIYGLSALILVAHLVEALYSVYLSQWKLKLGRFSSFCWFLMIFLAGIPITRRLMKLDSIQEQARQKAKSH